MTTATARRYSTFIRFLTPTALAALSVELDRERDNLTTDEAALLDNVNSALVANVGEDDADGLRQWYCENI
jgi:nitrate/nitrite transporter NarK